MMRTLTIHEESNHLNEAELIARTQNGDTEAFNPIVRRYQQRIYDLIYKRVGHHETAEDICQEAFLKAWQALPNYKRNTVFYNWLYQIAVNCSIDYLCKEGKEIILTSDFR